MLQNVIPISSAKVAHPIEPTILPKNLPKTFVNSDVGKGLNKRCAIHLSPHSQHSQKGSMNFSNFWY